MTVGPSSQDVALVHAYLATTWLVHLPSGDRLLRIGEPFRDAPALPCGIVTAYNPRSSERSESVNRAANEELRRELGALSASTVPTTARDASGDGRWDEPGYLVWDVSRADAVRIAGGLEQNAIVWVEQDAIPHLLVGRPGFLDAQPGHRIPEL